MRAGLVGFVGTGKSTLFQLLTGVVPDPGKVHTGQVGMAIVRDPRLEFLAELYRPKKVTPATVELLDTPGLMPGSHGDNPQRLALIRQADALLVVLGGFSGGDPARELTAFREEALFADLAVVANRVQRLETDVKKPRPEREAMLQELDLLRRVQDALENGRDVASLNLSAEQKKPMRSFGLLTEKPTVVILNTTQGSEVPPNLLALAPAAIAVDAQLELELEQMTPDERASFQNELGITELSRDRIIRAAYHAVGILTFFTAGEPEVRGWNLERGGTAVEAAGKIHTDLARGFIRAEVTAFDDLKRLGSMREVKAANLLRLEGKDYVVQDGDIVYFRSSV
ncbi:MAG: ribosome-binding ATPase YchF [Isosphaeraceae bacterium]|jgi:GTP-binding protein YchF|nr:MAG: ribosome-binding ATPase YchF [Isosphaeraceae bacterium]